MKKAYEICTTMDIVSLSLMPPIIFISISDSLDQTLSSNFLNLHNPWILNLLSSLILDFHLDQSCTIKALFGFQSTIEILEHLNNQQIR